MAVLSNTGIRAGAAGAAGSGYQIKKSIRLEGDDEASLRRTFSAGDKKKWTYSYWMRRNDGRGHWYNSFFWAGSGLSGNLRFDDPNTNQMYGILASGVTMNTTRRFRDFSAWMHVVVVWDSNNTTAGDRFRLYINGVRETSFTSISAISEGLDSAYNGNEIHGIGHFNSNTGLTCYIADVYFVDGYAKEPSDFGETDEDTGEWVPKEYEDSLVEFSESTASGFSYWAGMGDDWEDSESTESGTNDYINRALPSDSKVYWEVTINNAGTYRNFGLQTGTGGLGEGYNDSTVGYYYNGNPPLFMVSGGGGGNGITHGSSTGVNWVDGKKLMFAWDPTGGGSTGKLYLGYDGTWYNSGNPSCGTGAVLTGMNTSSSWYLKTGYNNGGGSMTFTNVASGSAEWLPGSCTTTYHKNSCHLKFEGTDLGEDSSGNDNNWTVNNITQGFYTISSPNLPTWDQADSGWAKSNSDKNGTYTGSSTYGQIVTSALTDATTYHFFYIKDDADATGGWFFADTQTPSDTHPDELSGNSLGQRATETSLGTYGTYSTANSTSDGQSQISGFTSIQDKKVDIEFVVNRTVDKVWCRKAGDADWIGGGDPTNTSSTASFALPDGDTVYFGHVGYSATTTANFSDTAGKAMDIDVSSESPTNYDDGANGGGTYCTWNPLDKGSGLVLSQGNLRIKSVTNDFVRATIGMTSGKWYYEETVGAGDHMMGLADGNADNTYYLGQTHTNGHNSWGWYKGNGALYTDNDHGTLHASSSSMGTYTTGDVIGVAFDADNGALYFSKNGTWTLSATKAQMAAGTTTNAVVTGLTKGPYFFAAGLDASTANHNANFGQRAWAYPDSVPDGFKALNTYNLADPTIKDPSKYFNTVLYEGDSGSSNPVTGVGFEPDLVWLKVLNNANNNGLIDQVRGDTKLIYSSLNVEEDTISDFSFDSDGFTVQGTDNTYNGSYNYVAWNWDAGTATSNTSVSVGGLNSTLYDQSDTWTDDVTGTPHNDDSANYGPDHIFDGSSATYAQPKSGESNGYQWTPSGGYAFSGAIEIEAYFYDPNSTCVVSIVHGGGTTDVASQFKDDGSLTINTITGITSPITSIKYYFTNANDYCSFSRVWIGGKLLIDNGISVTNVPTIASEYRTNPDAGFSIVTYTGNSTAGATFAHGLNAKPDFVVVKSRNYQYNWYVYHKDIGNTHNLFLNLNNVKSDDNTAWNDTDPDSNIITIGNSGDTNYNGSNIVAYCWSEVAGYSKFGKYTGNGSAEGPFVWCGFKPAFLMIKKHNSADNWLMWDNARGPSNENTKKLAANLADTENSTSLGNDSYNMIDFVSNGFKFRNTASSANGSGDEFIFAAFADKPFKHTNAR